MSANTFLFYDLETSGLSKTFAQVVEFAAIRTTTDFEEIEREHFYVKLTRDTVPAPDAFITHQIGLDKLATGLPENEAITKIHAMFNRPGTISLGYNTLGFDDEFLRFSFARCLLPPYTHQYLNSCGRMDLYPITVLYYLFKDNVMLWPDIDGKPSMKLENIAGVNNWLTGQAHHAMTDVEATLSLAKALAKAEDMWKFSLGYFNKQQDIERMQTYCQTVLSTVGKNIYHGIVVWGKLGLAVNYAAPAICFGIHKHYKNQSIWLRLDKELLTSETDNMHKFILRKKLGEAPIVLPFKSKYSSVLSEESKNIMQQNLDFFEENPSIFHEISEYSLTAKYPDVSNVDLDANLYQMPFPSREMQYLCHDFLNAVTTHNDSSLLPAFIDKNLQAKATRYLWRYYPELLPEIYKQEMNNYWELITGNSDNVFDFKAEPRYSPLQALRRSSELVKEDLAPQQNVVLRQLLTYLNEKFGCEVNEAINILEAE
jgi:exodeoxyribonuclease-1